MTLVFSTREKKNGEIAVRVISANPSLNLRISLGVLTMLPSEWNFLKIRLPDDILIEEETR